MTSLERMELTVPPRLLIQLASEQPTYTLSALGRLGFWSRRADAISCLGSRGVAV